MAYLYEVVMVLLGCAVVAEQVPQAVAMVLLGVEALVLYGPPHAPMPYQPLYNLPAY